MDLAEEWKHVMFAQTEHLDVFDDHHFVIIDFEQSTVQKLSRILLISTGQELDRFRHALWRPLQAVALGILTDVLDNLQIRFLQSRFSLIHFWPQRFWHRHHTFCCCAFHSISLHTCAVGELPLSQFASSRVLEGIQHGLFDSHCLYGCELKLVTKQMKQLAGKILSCGHHISECVQLVEIAEFKPGHHNTLNETVEVGEG